MQVQPKSEKRKYSTCEWKDLHSHSFLSHFCCSPSLLQAPGVWLFGGRSTEFLPLNRVYRIHRWLPTFYSLNRLAVLSYGILFSRNEATATCLCWTPPRPQAPQPWLAEVIKCGLNSPWQNIWTLVQVMMEESKTPKWAAPAANHVQQPWNVYSQAYTKAARNSIVTQIGAEKAFGAFASLMRWENDTGETGSSPHCGFYKTIRLITHNPQWINAKLILCPL